jgi:hypothetical protein
MMGRYCVAAMLLAMGCGKELNPQYCATHPEDTDCYGAGLSTTDAPVGCEVTHVCDSEPVNKVCEVDTGNCVQCIPEVDVTACTGSTSVCGDDRTCHGCLVDTHCTASNVCLPSGDCANTDDVLYVSPQGQGNCTATSPCKLADAVGMISPTKKIIKMTTAAGTDYTDPAFTINKPVLVLGTGTTLTGSAITVDGAAVEIVGLTLVDATADALSCSNGDLTLRRVTVNGSPGYGVHTTKCTATIERSRFSKNPLGGMFLDEGTFEVRNNIVDHNGSTALATGNVRFNKAKGRFVFNTVAYNSSENGGGGRIAGVACAGSAGLRVGRNIIVANGAANTLTGGDCKFGPADNYISAGPDAVKFVSNLDLHLTAASPKTNPIIVDDIGATPDCQIDGQYIDDFDGQPRPVNGFCDRGADEYRP